MSRIERFTANSRGRDLAVGDIHGHFQRLERCLGQIAFDARRDRLFSVGDLVDRGPDSIRALEWLAQPWFHAVQGNHESLAVNHVMGGRLDPELYRAAGGGWFLDLAPSEQRRFAERFAAMPIALEVETGDGLIGLLHADCPFADWHELTQHVHSGLDEAVQEFCQWSRRRLQQEDVSRIAGLRALVVGHTPLRTVKVLGNVWHIDTAGWASGHFSVLDLPSLSLVSATPDAR
ncbi:Serine/threonine-protein phosphatase 2 [Pseudomonas fluorescens]|uniref:metallophosphoesterase n=1 Tax=Pseudomonas fluorescens TaxID=294 RepID=UPI0012582BE4|nr:metallophosphoesterase [Pseudomonas fluorescens]CAG8863541.1 Serine/threonine-protein phosphatase 2 [Pseudomonas fluorescens]